MNPFRSIVARLRGQTDNIAVPTHKDYAQDVSDAGHRDIIAGHRLVCSLDESTCLQCLELDGSTSPPKLPIHEGCRCVVLPIYKSFADLAGKGKATRPPTLPGEAEKIFRRNLVEMGFTEEQAARERFNARASAIGPVRADGGIYKAYLIERARTVKCGMTGSELAQHLQNRLPSLATLYPDEAAELTAIRTRLMTMSSTTDLPELETIMRRVSWPCDELAALVNQCAQHQAFALIDDTLGRLAKQVPSGEYAARHKGMIYRQVGNAVKKQALPFAIRCFEQAAAHDAANPTVAMELGKLYRRSGQIEKAKRMFEAVLIVKSDHKGAQKEFAKLR